MTFFQIKSDKFIVLIKTNKIKTCLFKQFVFLFLFRSFIAERMGQWFIGLFLIFIYNCQVILGTNLKVSINYKIEFCGLETKISLKSRNYFH